MAKYITIEGVSFAYGYEQLLAALQSNAEYARCRGEYGEKAARATSVLGQADQLPFQAGREGLAGVRHYTACWTCRWLRTKSRGAIGVDLNADHLAVCETDASAAICVYAFSVPLVTYGKARHQAEAIIGDAVANVVEYAREAGQARRH